MTGDYMTKSLHGKKYVSFRQDIMFLPHDPHIASIVQQECVGSNESNHARDNSWTLVKAKAKPRSNGDESPYREKHSYYR
jgi:hypothetical protein